MGIFVSGLLLSLGVRQGKLIDEQTMQGIVIPYIVLTVGIYLLSIWSIRGYSMTRSDHSETLSATGKA